MSETTVFVDDAVQGHLPYVCVKSGEPADGLERVEQQHGASPWSLLLIFFFPIGWIILFAISGRSSYLTVRLPMSYPALHADRALRRVRLVAGLVAVLALVGAIGLRHEPMLFPPVIAAAGVAVLVAIVYAIRISLNTVGIELDASGRWVTLRGVHPNFARAVAERPVRERTDHSNR